MSKTVREIQIYDVVSDSIIERMEVMGIIPLNDFALEAIPCVEHLWRTQRAYAISSDHYL
jgi:hypothetical protein